MTLFTRCTLTMAGGMTPQCMGFAATEIHAALLLSGLPAERWPDISEDVYSMGQVVAKGLNERMAQAAKT